MNQVESLIPHKEPFLFVDEVISANEEEIIGIKTFDRSLFLQGHFPDNPIVPGVVLVESMAQCGGAGLRKQGKIAGDALYGLAALDDVQFLGRVEAGKVVKMVVHTARISSSAIKQSGIAYCNGKAVAKATWICVKLNGVS